MQDFISGFAMSFLFLLMLTAYGLGALSALIIGRGALGRGLAAAGATIGAAAAFGLGMAIIASGIPFEFSITELLPLTGLALRVDGLGAFFLIIIGLLGMAAAIYGFGYSQVYEGRYSLRLLGAFFLVLAGLDPGSAFGGMGASRE